MVANGFLMNLSRQRFQHYAWVFIYISTSYWNHRYTDDGRDNLVLKLCFWFLALLYLQANLQMFCFKSAVDYDCIETKHYESISDMTYVNVTWVGHEREHHLTSLADLRHAALLFAPSTALLLMRRWDSQWGGSSSYLRECSLWYVRSHITASSRNLGVPHTVWRCWGSEKWERTSWQVRINWTKTDAEVAWFFFYQSASSRNRACILMSF